MPNVSSPAALPQYIEQLLNKRKQLTADLATIEATLGRVTTALGVATAMPAAMESPRSEKAGPAVQQTTTDWRRSYACQGTGGG